MCHQSIIPPRSITLPQSVFLVLCLLQPLAPRLRALCFLFLEHPSRPIQTSRVPRLSFKIHFKCPLFHEAPWLLSFSSELLCFCLYPAQSSLPCPVRKRLDPHPNHSLPPQPWGFSWVATPKSSSSQLFMQTWWWNLGTSHPTAFIYFFLTNKPFIRKQKKTKYPF